MASPLLSEAAINELTRVVVDGALYDEAALRATFFGATRAIFAQLPIVDTPDAQARSDLFTLSTTRQSDGGAPLEAWLTAVHGVLHGRDNPDARVVDRHLTDVRARLRAEQAAGAAVTADPSRTIDHDGLVLHAAADAAAAQSLRGTLPGRRLRFEDRLLAPGNTEAWRFLESMARRSHAAVVWLSPAALAQMEAAPERARQALQMLEGLCATLIGALPEPTEAAVQRARALWPFRVLAPPTAVAEPMGPPIVPRAIGVPFVFVVPTAAEVAELLAEPSVVATLGPAKHAEFVAVQAAVAASGSELARRYGSQRARWCPFDDGQSLVTLVHKRIEHLNLASGSANRRLVAQFYPFDPLVAGDAALQPLYDDLARTGCVVVLDELSLFHPRLRRAFLATPFQHAPNTAMVTVRPLDANHLPTLRPIHDAPLDALSHALYRYRENLDPSCLLGIGNPVRLDRWLHTALPGVVEALRAPRADPQRLARFMAGEGGRGVDLGRVLYFEPDR